jgi:hypothetical protein
MPKIRWERFQGELGPLARPREESAGSPRRIGIDLAEWKAQDPDVPDGDWYKDFGTFKLRDRGKFPGTFLNAGTLNAPAIGFAVDPHPPKTP